MPRKKKKKLRIKWKNLIVLLCLIFLVYSAIAAIHKSIETNKEEKPFKESLKTMSKKEKLEMLENIQKEIDYVNEDYIDRYLIYKEKNPNLEIIQVIKNVNMNLDQTPYEYTIPMEKIDTPILLVNKYYYLDENYEPKNLETLELDYALSNMRLVNYAKDAFEKLSQDASKEGLSIIAMSTYRSYSYQVNLYNRYVKEDGQESADTYSGRPGHSEHQTGLAVDVKTKDGDFEKFEETKEYEWMQENAHKYGFILRFPKGKEKETGYQFESWHYRYVGEEIAKYIKENNITLEEYYATKIKDW